MALKKCKECEKEISSSAKQCPGCGKDQRNWFMRHKFLTSFIVVIVFIIVAVGGSDSSTSNTKSVSTKSDTNRVMEEKSEPNDTFMEEKEIVEVEDPNPHFDNGVFVVGEEIEPGTYRTRTANSSCYYSRLSGFKGDLDDIISNENTDYPAVVTIAEGDKGFKSTRCGTWTKDLSQITDSKTSFGDGIFIVGTDIEPGTYKNSGQSSCYYSRLSGFGGDLGDIISNENTDDVAIVTIAASDKGFKSTRCGTWTKME